WSEQRRLGDWPESITLSEAHAPLSAFRRPQDGTDEERLRLVFVGREQREHEEVLSEGEQVIIPEIDSEWVDKDTPNYRVKVVNVHAFDGKTYVTYEQTYDGDPRDFLTRTVGFFLSAYEKVPTF